MNKILNFIEKEKIETKKQKKKSPKIGIHT
jgi:hypothetical protein